MKTDMHVSEHGLEALAAREGLALVPYKDSVGVWTVGLGHTDAAGPPRVKDVKKMTIAQVMELFKKDVKKYEDRVKKAVNAEILQHEFDALVSFDYNTGGIFRARLTKLLNSHAPRKAVADAFLGWLQPPEIRGRREGEMRQFLYGNDEFQDDWVTIYEKTNSRGYPVATGRVRAKDLIQSPVTPATDIVVPDPACRTPLPLGLMSSDLEELPPKSPLQSKTMAGIAVTAIFAFAQAAGVEIPFAQGEAQTWVYLTGEAVGLGLAAYGRWKARRQLVA